MKKSLKTPSFARLSPLAKGCIVGMREAGTERKAIAKQVKKKDGKSPSIGAVDNVLERFKEQPDWDGLEEREAGGLPRDDLVAGCRYACRKRHACQEELEGAGCALCCKKP